MNVIMNTTVQRDIPMMYVIKFVSTPTAATTVTVRMVMYLQKMAQVVMVPFFKLLYMYTN